VVGEQPDELLAGDGLDSPRASKLPSSPACGVTSTGNGHLDRLSGVHTGEDRKSERDRAHEPCPIERGRRLWRSATSGDGHSAQQTEAVGRDVSCGVCLMRGGTRRRARRAPRPPPPAIARLHDARVMARLGADMHKRSTKASRQAFRNQRASR
jgi:hypothetical protein